MSKRDLAVLGSVDQHRYLTTRQIESFHFADHATPLTGARAARRVLRRLAELRVLDHLERRIGGIRAGSASFIWQVGPVGDRLLRAERGGARQRQREPSELFLQHCLAVAKAHLALVEADRAGVIELVSVATEPTCWRRYTGLGGSREILKPDLYVVTGDPADAGFINCWFVEVDRGTENPARLLDKCQSYEAYRRTGAEQQAAGSFPMVVWGMSDEAQAERLRVAIAEHPHLGGELYRVTTLDGLVELIAGGVV